MALSRLLARPLLASYFVLDGAQALKDAPTLAAGAAPVTGALAPAVDAVTPDAVHVGDDPQAWVRVTGAVQVVAALGLASGRAPRLCAAALAATLVPSTAVRHRFWEADDAGRRNADLVQVTKNASLLGGLLIAALDTEGRPGVAWRTRHAARDARREAALVGAKVRAKVS